MFWNCTICTDVLDLSKPICFAPCGHIFHRGCLETWLLESGTCPECRTSVNSASLKKVFPNGKVLSDEMYIAHNVDGMLEEIREQKEEIREQKEEYRYLRNRCNDFKEFANKFQSEAASYKRKYLHSEHHLSLAHMYVRKMKPLEIENKNLKIELANLKVENEFHKNVKTIVQGQQKEVDKIISRYQNDAKDGQKGCKESVQNLATFLAMLKREYDMLLRKQMELNMKSGTLKVELIEMNQKYSKLQKMYNSMRNKSALQKKDGNLLNMCVPNYYFGVNCAEHSPISIKLMEKKKIVDDVGGKPSSFSACNDAKIDYPDFPIKNNRVRFPIAIGPNVQKNGRTMIHPDPKLVRRVKLSKK